jgi:hypothetical protein
MTIYKTAQIQFANEAEIVKQIGKIRDGEFKLFVSFLSQMHADMTSRSLDLNEAAVEAGGEGSVSALTRLVGNIGISTFLGSNLSQITDALSALRVQPEEKLMSGFVPGVSQPDQPSAEQHYLDVGALLGMTPDERADYFSSLNYPDAYRERAFHMIENMKDIDRVYSDPDVPEVVRNRHQKELVSAFLSLIKMAKGESEDPEYPGPSVGLRGGRTLPSPTPDSSAPEKKKRKRSKSTSSSVSNIKDEEILDEDVFSGTKAKETQLSSGNAYVDYTVSPPVVNTDDITTVFGSFITKIEELMRDAQGANSDENDIMRRFNDLAFSVKKADYIVFNDFLEKKKIMPAGQEAAYKLIEDELRNWLPSQRILSDIDFSETFKSASVICADPLLGFMIFTASNDEIYNKIQSDKRNSHITEGEIGDIKDGLIRYVDNAFKTKSEQFFDLESTYSQKNFLGKIGLRWDIVFYRTVQKVKVQGPEYYYKPCPTCFKYIPHSYTTKAKKHAPDSEEMKIKLYSFFTKNPEMPKITIDHLNSKSWGVLPPSMYTEEREQKKVLEYAKAGEKTWEEITALVNSGNYEEQEEGLHRRSAALAYSGGIELTTKDLKITSIMSSCPVDGDGGSGCGISFNPVSNSALSPRLSLQPTWNGERSDNTSGGGVNIIDESAWEDKSLLEQAKRLQQGGRKFSAVNFACTCRIKDISDMSSYKHGNLAISKPGPAGSNGFVFPTKPDGSADTELKDGTLSFLVCGAPTSLSAFERDSKNSGFILKHLLKIKDESLSDYADMIGYLIRQGLEFDDVMMLDQNLDQYAEQSNSGFADATVKARMHRLTEIIKESGIVLREEGTGSDIRRLFGGLTLVCPFGHRFTVEHSLKFGRNYAGIFSKKNTAETYSDVVTTEGDSNIRSMLKPRAGKTGHKKVPFLVPVSSPDMAEFTKLRYEEWIKHDNRTVYPIPGKRDRPVLIFELPSNLNGDKSDFMFYSKPLGGKALIWNPEGSYDSANQKPAWMPLTEEEKAALQATTSTSDGGFVDLMDSAQAKKWREGQINEDSDQPNKPPGKPIPGAGKLLDQENEADQGQLDLRINAFARTIRSSLRVINTWTKGVVNDGMIDAMLSDRSVDVTLYEDRLYNILAPYVMMEVLDDDGEEVEPDQATKAQLTALSKRALIESLNQKVNNLYDWIRTNIYGMSDDDTFNGEIASKIIESCIKEFNSLEPGGDLGYVYLNVDKKGMDQFAANIAMQAVKMYPALVSEITLSSSMQKEAEKNRVQYIGRVALISYAQYLATSLSLVYKKYCADPSSDFYIGYDIGIDLSSKDKIIGFEREGQWVGGIASEDAEGIVSSLEEALSNGPFPRLKPQTLEYGHRIDKAWESLEAYLRTSRKQTMSAMGMEASKDYLVSRISSISSETSPEKLKELKSKISNVFPNRSLLFSGTASNPETGISQITKRRLPFFAKVFNMTQLPNTERVEEWITRDTDTGEIRVFQTEEEANAYQASLPDSEIKVRPDPYWINPEFNYDGSKAQVGITAPKNQAKLKWPPAPGGFPFVGFNIPFAIRGRQVDRSMNKTKKVPIPNFRIVVDLDGEPLDISLLFRRGQEKADLKNINGWESIILKKTQDSRATIRAFMAQNSEAILKDEKILSRFRAEEEGRLSTLVDPYLRSIESVKLNISTTSSYVDPDGMTDRPMMRATLEDPMAAYRIINNPEIRGKTISKVERDRYIQFIIRVYNLNLIRDMLRTKGGIYEHLQSVDLLEKAHSMKFSPATKMMKEPVWTDPEGVKRPGYFTTPGEYFDINPGEKNSNTGSFIQYVHSTSPNKKKDDLGEGSHPPVGKLFGADRYVKMHGLENSGEISSSGKGLSRKIEEDMLGYITSRTSGSRANPAKDKRRKNASSHSNEISLRRSKLDRMILSLGIFDFDDVEMPNF